MNAPRIFLSHGGPDSAIAERIADRLRGEGLEPVLDRDALGGGASFITFMEDALSTSDYCLLLWSVAAATRKWVQQEWQAALHKSVVENRSFLVVGRLDTHALPALLAPRLFIDLHPQIGPGIEVLVATWRDDRAAEQRSHRPVASAGSLGRGDIERPAIYLTSELFGITTPWHADLDAPAGVLLDDVRRRLALPDSLDHEGRVGVRFEYHLALDERRLERLESLADQGVEQRSVLWIESETKLFAATDPSMGKMGTTVFRGSRGGREKPTARSLLATWVDEAGLGWEADSRGRSSGPSQRDDD
jgi:hypothetical protein